LEEEEDYKARRSFSLSISKSDNEIRRKISRRDPRRKGKKGKKRIERLSEFYEKTFFRLRR